MVKDLRTGHQSSNPTAVLDGALDKYVSVRVRVCCVVRACVCMCMCGVFVYVCVCA